MSVDLHRLQVEITAQTKKFKRKCDEVKAEAKKTVSAANRELSRIGDSGVSGQAAAQLEDIKNQTKSISDKVKSFSRQVKIDAGLLEPTKEYDTLSKSVQKAQNEVEKLKSKQDSLSSKDARNMTEAYSACSDQIRNVEKRIDSLIAKQQSWLDIGVNPKTSTAFQKLDDEIELANAELKKYQDRMAQMETAGKAFKPSEKFLSLQRQIQAAREQIKHYKTEQGKMSDAGTDYTPTKKAGGGGQTAKAYAAAAKQMLGKVVTESAKVHPALKRAMSLAQQFGNVSRKAFKGAGAAARGLATPLKVSVSWLKKLASGFGTVYQRIRKLIPGMNRTRSSMDGLGQSCGKLLGKFGALRISATYMFASFLIMGSINAMKEGFKSLSQYSGQTNSDLSMLMSSLIQLRNSLATAFAPILTVVAPILNTLIGWLTSATTAIAHFFAALTGQSKVVVAKKVNTDFAGSLEGAGNAADDANDKTKKYQKTLMGFDQINKLDEPTSNNSSGSSGGGGLSPGDMFETVEIDNKWANWADRMKEAWKNADFTEIGEILGNKLNAALEGIPWDKIKATSRKIAKSIATFLNGFIAATDWKLVGATFAEGINTVIEFAYTFVTTFNWKKFGTAIGNAINGFFAKIDLSKAGKTLSNGIKGVLDTAIKMVTTIDWSKIGAKIADFICNIDWVGVAKKIIKLLGNAIVGACNLLSGFIDKVGDYLSDYIESGDFWRDVFGLVKLSFKITAKIIGAAWDLLCSLIDNGVNIVVSLVKSGAAWLWALISGQEYETAKKQIELAFKLPESKIVNFVKEVAKFLALPGPLKIQVLMELIKKGFNTIAEWLFGSGKKEGKETVKIDRKKNWKTSISKWVGDKMTLLFGRKKNWKTSISAWVGNKMTLLFGRKKGWSGSLLSWVLNGAKSLSLRFNLPRIGVNWGSASLAGFKISYPKGFYTYATGGFPEEGPFMMNRGEIAGKFSNGKGVVANNQQITDGIANAVGPAVYQAVLSAMTAKSDGGGNVTVVLEGDAKKLFKAIKTEAQKYTNSTGLSAFPV